MIHHGNMYKEICEDQELLIPGGIDGDDILTEQTGELRTVYEK